MSHLFAVAPFCGAASVLGVLFLAVLFTRGFGLWSGSGKGTQGPAAVVHQGDKILVPEGSALRNRLTVEPAPLRPVSGKLVLPAVVESDPARTASVLTPLSGRLIALKVSLGDRVSRGQMLAVIDSPDLGQAYEDNEKAADTFKLTEKNLERQEAQNKLGVASDRDLDQARSDHAQAAAEYTRTQARLKMLGVPLEPPKASPRLLTRDRADGGQRHRACGGSRQHDQRSDPADDDRRRLEHRLGHRAGSRKGRCGGRQKSGGQVSLLAYPDRVLHGKVLFVSDVIEADSRRDKIRIAFANSDYALKPNMFATVTLTGPEQSQVVLPSSALLMNNDEPACSSPPRPGLSSAASSIRSSRRAPRSRSAPA